MAKEEFCYTCDRFEPHRKLTGRETAWLKNRLGRAGVHEFLVCLAPGCRNLRTGGNKRPFDDTIRLPVLD
ncbi:hypothetical protein [Streptomyces sp. NRRL B-1347]|uniref:hypothetical protein n=1 Tax=Streptomyces sp. NRRL B-1347 TaxID=1476877 RepID=UPI0004C8845D|nr:hypothetical protein [Streptomyces sp. NRRL B-1347]